MKAIYGAAANVNIVVGSFSSSYSDASGIDTLKCSPPLLIYRRESLFASHQRNNCSRLACCECERASCRRNYVYGSKWLNVNGTTTITDVSEWNGWHFLWGHHCQSMPQFQYWWRIYFLAHFSVSVWLCHHAFSVACTCRFESVLNCHAITSLNVAALQHRIEHENNYRKHQLEVGE